MWNWGEVNYAAELVKILGTMLGVGIGAYAAFHFASVGRKQDVLIKERYKAIEELNGICNEIGFNCRQIRHSIESQYMISETIPQGNVNNDAIKYFNATADIHMRAIKNNKYMLMFPAEFEDRYRTILRDYHEVIGKFSIVLNSINGDEYEYSRMRESNLLKDIVNQIKSLDKTFDELIRDMVKLEKYHKI